jgi:hypothetical protein
MTSFREPRRSRSLVPFVPPLAMVGTEGGWERRAMIPWELIGRRVRVIAWCDRRRTAAARQNPPTSGDGPGGAVTPPDADDLAGQIWVRVEGLERVFVLRGSDVGVLPPRVIGSRRGAGPTRRGPAVAEERDGSKEPEVEPRGAG